VEYPGAPAGTRTFALSANPLFRVGDDPGEREMEYVSFGALLPDGGAVFADGRSPEVIRVGPDGAVLTTLARSGEGPREVGGVGAIRNLGGDTVFVQDVRNGRVMAFVGDSLVRALSTASDRGLARSSQVVGRVGDTLLVTLEDFSTPPVDGWVPGRMLRISMTTGAVDTIGAFDLADPAGLVSGPRPAFPIGGKGIGSGEYFVTARSDLAQLTWWGRDGAPRQILRWNPPRTHPTEADLDAYLVLMRSEMKRLNRSMSDAQLERIMMQQRPLMIVDPSVPYPLFMELQGDGAGGVWMSDYTLQVRPLDGVPHWSIIAPEGQWLGEITLPDHFRLLDVRGGRVLGVQMDSLDIQSVAVFDLIESPRAR
jgi:hypothetical protein